MAFAASVAMPAAHAQDFGPVTELSGAYVAGGSSGTVSVLLPFELTNESVLFADARGSTIDGGFNAVSLGVGYRTPTVEGWVLGLNSYIDYLRTDRGNDFTQAGFGVEAIGRHLEFRANAYLPFGTDVRAEADFNRAFLDSGRLFFRQGQEQALRGADAEIGGRIPVLADDSPVVLRAFAGGFITDGEGLDIDPGVSARAEVSFLSLPGLPSGSALTVGAGATYSDREKGDAFASLRLRVPLGGATSGGNVETDPMLRRVERASRIRTHLGTTGEREDAVYADGGARIGGVAVLSAVDGDAAALNALAAAQGANGLLLATGTIDLDDTLTVGAGQRLVGANQAVFVRGAGSGGSASFSYKGEGATLRGVNAGADVVALSSGAQVSGLGILGGRNGIAASGSRDIRISDVDVSRVAANGIALNDVSGAVIRDSAIHDLPICNVSTGCEFSIFDPNFVPNAAINALGTSDLSVSNVAIANTTYGIFAGARYEEVDFSFEVVKAAERISILDVDIVNSRREGVLLVGAKDVAIDDLSIDNGALGLDMDLVVLQKVENARLRGLDLTGGINGLLFANSFNLPGETRNISVADARISNTSRAGIFINPASNLSFDDVSITNAGTYGVYFYGDPYGFAGGPVTDVSLRGVGVDGAGNAGIYVSGPIQNIDGEIAISGAPVLCDADGNGELTQVGGEMLRLNGSVVTSSNFAAVCP